MKIAPCRYCGTVPLEAQAVQQGNREALIRFWVSCHNPACWSDGPMARSPWDAIRKWNNGVGKLTGVSSESTEEGIIENIQP